MIIRERFERQLHDLRQRILAMGAKVEEQMKLALDALDSLDTAKAHEVHLLDNEVNAARFSIEEECFTLIVTQQPAASDLRLVVAALNIIVDLERMGDQAKGIAKVIPHLLRFPQEQKPPELAEMGQLGLNMLHRALQAYAHTNVDIARIVARQEVEVDSLYGRVFNKSIAHMAETTEPEQTEAAYELLRVARELERFADLSTNIAERVIYLVTGSMEEVNVDRDDSSEGPQ